MSDFANAPTMSMTIKEKIHRLRSKMLVHSYLYYELDAPIVSDEIWQRWANELALLQNNAPSLKLGFYDREFADWDGSTGMHLPRDHWTRSKAEHVAKLHAQVPLPPASPARVEPVQSCLF